MAKEENVRVPSDNEIWDFLRTKEDQREKIAEKFIGFGDEIIPELLTLWNESCDKQVNIYQLCGAKLLSGANAVTRTFSTKLGFFMERIADLAPNVASPEYDFYGKVPDIDVVVAYQGHLYWTQMKNQKNTLTGSQTGRTRAALEAFPYHWFAVSFDTKAKPTFNVPYMIVGEAYWEKLGIDYRNDIVVNLKKLVSRVENALVESM